MKAIITISIVLSMLTSASVLVDDSVQKEELVDRTILNLWINTSEGGVERTFRFPTPIVDYKLLPFTPGDSLIVAAKPANGSDWYWGVAYFKDSNHKTVITKWSKSPPADAVLLSITQPQKGSVVIYAARFNRNFPNANEIETFAYVNHCPSPFFAEYDLGGQLYSGNIGGPYKPGVEPE